MTSTHMVLRKGAFDAYDTIFCVGPIMWRNRARRNRFTG